GLSTATDVLLRWKDVNGNPSMTRLSPTIAAADGTSATLVLPREANGAYRLQVFGSASQPLLQIVPTLDGFDVSGTQTSLVGSGFVEGGGSYAFQGLTLADTSTDGATDVYYSDVQNGRVYFNNTASQHGLGTVSATTAGGTSEALNLNFLRMPIGTPGDVAV
ncbi:hypothetical protein LZ009_24200, partial [Ramlibacter sp. XY19]|uniref:hypothetical protein n=1 Tax=Ramlibacter paludis TaxID=2908000 RepID=UPI0023D9B8DF